MRSKRSFNSVGTSRCLLRERGFAWFSVDTIGTTECPATFTRWAGSALRLPECGIARYGGEARNGDSRGRGWANTLTDGYQRRISVILGLGNVSTPELKIRAECGNPACSDLCGGPEATPVPTATVRSAVEGGQTVNYSATPIYNGANLVPRGITIMGTGSGDFNLGVTILNPIGR